MPEIDGLEATRLIKLIDSSVYVVAITAYAMSGDEVIEPDFNLSCRTGIPSPFCIHYLQ